MVFLAHPSLSAALCHASLSPALFIHQPNFSLSHFFYRFPYHSVLFCFFLLTLSGPATSGTRRELHILPLCTEHRQSGAEWSQQWKTLDPRGWSNLSPCYHQPLYHMLGSAAKFMSRVPSSGAILCSLCCTLAVLALYETAKEHVGMSLAKWASKESMNWMPTWEKLLQKYAKCETLRGFLWDTGAEMFIWKVWSWDKICCKKFGLLTDLTVLA